MTRRFPWLFADRPPCRVRRAVLPALAIAPAALIPGVAASLLRGARAAADEDSGAVPVEMALGRADAPVTVIEYFSFSCAHCARFHRETFPELKRNYIEPGKVRFVVRDFPLNLAALTAARLARCAGPARYFDILDLFWGGWDDWINKPDPEPALLALLETAGIRGAELETCRNDPAFEEQVLNSYRQGARDHGIDRTPTFLIGGRKYIGLSSYGRFAGVLDSLLE